MDLCSRCGVRSATPTHLFGPGGFCHECREELIEEMPLVADDPRLAQSRLPPRYWVIDNTNPHVKAAARHVDLAWRREQGLLLEGPVGTGKTLAAALMVHRLAARGATCLFISVPAYADALRQQKPPVSVERLKTVQHLVLDDLGAEYDKTGWWFSTLYQIVDARWQMMRLTSATCNAFKSVEPRILRRIDETAHTVVMERE